MSSRTNIQVQEPVHAYAERLGRRISLQDRTTMHKMSATIDPGGPRSHSSCLDVNARTGKFGWVVTTANSKKEPCRLELCTFHFEDPPAPPVAAQLLYLRNRSGCEVVMHIAGGVGGTERLHLSTYMIDRWAG